ncbi:MAG TPA: hemerythrin domain-containing protein [Candidatus Manganitrophaceae bacterium]|nr:hemerythrin domain-containing protein [Candidatus Manganitrophaceae bacterium]
MSNQETVPEMSDGHDDATQTLKDEHRATLLKLELMERALKYLQRGPENNIPERTEVEQALLNDLVGALKRGIGLHFQKEEEALFPILAEYTGKEYGPIEVMLHEHEKIRSAFAEWEKTLAAYENLGLRREEALSVILDAGFKLIDLIRAHIGKEDQIIFRICEAFLSEDERKQVIKIIKTIERDPPINLP